MPRRALLVWNPTAGRRPARRRRQLQQLTQGLQGGGWQVGVAETDPVSGARSAAARGVDAGCDVIIGCGGDGTLHEIVQVLAETPANQAPALAVAPPWGTANIMACALGVPPSAAKAAAWLLQAQARPAALGVATTPAGRRYFVAVASVGFDASIVHGVQPAAKRRWGKLAFVGAAATAWPRYFPAQLEYDCGDRRGAADAVLIGLTRFYGGRLRLGRVGPTGDAIQLALRGGPWLLPVQALGLLTRGLEYAPGVERLGPDPVAVLTPGLPVQLDGEAAGLTPVTFAVEPGRLRLWCYCPPPLSAAMRS
ncbi:MAG TPA: diacylglycerol kinase family protein [Terriglobales bacterium]|nr:diacylglycerol kinase family protein [Terriglobales bacterium]